MTESVNWGELMQTAATALQPVPKGQYQVVCKKAEAKTSSSGKLMFALQLTIEGPTNAGRSLRTYQTLSPENPTAVAIFMRSMANMGLDSTFFATNPAPSVVASALEGKRFGVEVDHQLYQGVMRDNVKSILPGAPTIGGAIPGGPMAPGAAPMPSPGHQ